MAAGLLGVGQKQAQRIRIKEAAGSVFTDICLGSGELRFVY